MYKVLLRNSTRRPRIVLAVMGVITIGALLMIPRIQLRLDGRSLIPAGEESLAPSDRAAATFGLKDIVVIAVVAERGEILTVDGLERVGRIAHALEKTPGIAPHSVTSITTLPLLVKRGGIIDPEPPIGPNRVDAARLERTRQEITALGLRNGIFLSRDGKAAAVYAFAEPGANREDLLDNVEKIAGGNRGGGYGIHIGGNALAQAELGRSVAFDLVVLVPFMLVALMTFMTVIFRTINAAVVSLAEIGLSLTWTIGLIGLLGQGVFITTLALPVVLIAIGVTDDIYALNRYIGLRRKLPNLPNAEIVQQAFEGVARPITLTALTSMAGLASLSFTNLEPLRVFGIFGALAIGLSTVFTFTVVPALLALVPPKLRESSTRSNRRLAKIASGLLAFIERVGPRRMVLGVLVLAVGALFVAMNLRIDDSWVKNLSPSSQVAEGDRVINEYLAGSTTVELAIETKKEDGFLDSARFATVARVEEALAAVGRVGAVQSTYSDVVRITATLAGMPYEEFRRRVADGREKLTRVDIETALGIDASLNRPSLGSYLNANGDAARLTVFVHGADYERLRPVFERAQAEFAAVKPAGIEGTAFGDGWISYLTVKMLVEGQIISIAFAGLSDLLLVTLLLRSFRGAAVAVLPVMVAVLCTFAVLVLIGSPLGIASSMFASIALGIGVDYSIHLSDQIRHACARAPNLVAALRRAFAETAPSIIMSASTITLGFGVLLLSSVVPNRMLGMLVIISLGMCALMTLLVVPGLSDIFGLWKTVRRNSPRNQAPDVPAERGVTVGDGVGG